MSQQPFTLLKMQRWVVICWALLALVGADECPDGGRCEEGQTCCNDPTNGYECCPFDQAECCGDHTHCCPADTVCDTSTSSCVNSTVSMPWVERTSAGQPRLSKSFMMIKSYMGEEDDNICPDQSRCPAEFSCLRALTRFGCCPLSQGVSCSDGKHCCPEGHQCSADSRSCIKKDVVTTVLCSDGVSECPDDTTCCENPEGKWECCPMPKAVCCSDKLHCCPEGTTCDVQHSKCLSTSTKKMLPMWAKFPARIRAEWENQKEGEQVTAQPVNDPGTEKVPEATSANTVPPFKEEVPASSITKAAPGNNVPCDETAACPDDTTCCKTKEGGWACCPLPEAVCCDDFVHCCPKDTTCDVAAGKCNSDIGSVPWVMKTPTIPRQDVQAKDVPCDDTTACPDDTTCCKTKEGGWACCPLPEAVCCDDFVHCCPKDTTCDVAAGTCDSDIGSVPWVMKTPTIPRQDVQAKDVPCDDTTACPDDTTCCKTKEGGWACCPLPEAVCCDDFVHCCPKDTTCDVAAGKCNSDIGSVPWVMKTPTIPRQDVQAKDVPCDDTTACPDDTTCCKTKEGGWACCPLPEAVCCDDFVHCCPKDTTCDVAAGKCNSDIGSVPWVMKIPTIPRQDVQAKDVPCDDTTACPDDTTCCKTKEGGWACCPLPEAVCCDDFVHCCPKDTTCDVAAGTCDSDIGSVPWVMKIPTIPRQDVQAKDVPCDDTTACPDDTTCCKTKEGGWACCPLPEAVCCDDHEHCCPQGTTCDTASLTCNGPSGSTLMQKKMLAFLNGANTTAEVTSLKQEEETKEEEEEDEKNENKEIEDKVQCDAHTSCPQYSTCCFMSSSQKWGCCPLPEAVCCADGSHCCPAHYKCDESQTSCIKGEVVIPWYTKLPATTSVLADLSSVLCDGVNQCPEHTTCCRLFTGEWGCCPLENAVCCQDREHCCPQGYTCNIAAMSCDKVIKLQLETVPLTPVYLPVNQPLPHPSNHRNIPCDERTSCHDDETCCKTSPTAWGCCPSPNAVCCSDMKHCCPTGYTCTDVGSCTMNTGLQWNNWHVFLPKKKRVLIV